jgi:hypothetical protein
MITTLAFRHLVVRKVRSLFLLLGFSIGVGVMVVLLSVGEAMLDQSRDVALVGGGEVTVLPQGIDVEAMRTGGLGGMFFTIERARFLTRQGIGGPRHASLVRTVAPAIEGKLLYLCPAAEECRPTAVRAGGEIPSRAAALGSGLDVLEGTWADSPADSSYIAPTPQQLYDELDRFHLPLRRDSTWGEWHYFNLVTGPDEWWYVTYLLGGEVSLTDRGRRWGDATSSTRPTSPPSASHSTRRRPTWCWARTSCGSATANTRSGFEHEGRPARRGSISSSGPSATATFHRSSWRRTSSSPATSSPRLPRRLPGGSASGSVAPKSAMRRPITTTTGVSGGT